MSLCRPIVLAALAASLAWACTEKDTSIGPEPGTGGGGGVAEGGNDSGPATACPEGLPGPKLIAVPAANGQTYCIDQREVVNSEYQTFLGALKGKAAVQPAECAWNKALEPELYDPTDPNDDGINSGKCSNQTWNADPSFAVVCVDFCDAWAYCAWAGKRLCGVAGAAGTAVNVMTAEQAQSTGTSTKSEWYSACSQGGATKFPYGDSYVAGRCVDAEKVKTAGKEQARSTQDTTDSSCHGTKAPFRDVHHLSGNAWEWQNTCADAGKSCAISGGSRAEAKAESLGCASLGIAFSGEINPLLGFRCCADAVPPGTLGGK